MRARRSITLGMLLLAPVASRPSWGAGHVDPAFGTGGAVVTPSGGQNAETGSRGVAVAGDGKIVALASGNAGATVVARFRATGALDPTFGTGGMVSLSLPNGFSPGAVAVRGGRIVVAGSSGLSPQVAALARLDGSGHLDPTFGTGGIVLTPMAGVSLGATRVAIAADGSVTAAGFSYDSALNWRAFVARYDASGVLDASYGAGGIALVPLAENVNMGDLAVESDGRAVVVGGVGPPPPPQTSLLPYTNFYVARFDASGAPDASFGTGGVVTGAVDGYFEGVALQPDGAIVAGGPAEPPGGDLEALIARFLPDGSPDATFRNGRLRACRVPGRDRLCHRVLLRPTAGSWASAPTSSTSGGRRFCESMRTACSIRASGLPACRLRRSSAAPTRRRASTTSSTTALTDGDIVASSNVPARRWTAAGVPSPSLSRPRLPVRRPGGDHRCAARDDRLRPAVEQDEDLVQGKGRSDGTCLDGRPGIDDDRRGDHRCDRCHCVRGERSRPQRRRLVDILGSQVHLRCARPDGRAPSRSPARVGADRVPDRRAGEGQGRTLRRRLPVPMPLTVTMLFNRSVGGCGRTAFVEGACIATASRVRCR
jgi:uncharacterized delta-60 repeat protein